MSKFSWPAYPATDAEFEAMMSAIDAELTSRGLNPWQRPVHIGFCFWDAFEWSGEAFPDRAIASVPGYTGNVLMAKAYRWYEEIYGEQLKISMAYGFSPVRLGNGVWRVRAGLTFGQVHLFAISPPIEKAPRSSLEAW